MENNIDLLRNLYKEIPKSKCKEGCYKCCTNMIQFTPSEEKQMGKYDYNGKCKFLVDSKCTIYNDRPFVCRIFGTSEILKCEDCIPDRFLTEEETIKLVHEYAIIKRKEEMETSDAV